jgi:hypothetical protein
VVEDVVGVGGCGGLHLLVLSRLLLDRLGAELGRGVMRVPPMEAGCRWGLTTLLLLLLVALALLLSRHVLRALLFVLVFAAVAVVIHGNTMSF